MDREGMADKSLVDLPLNQSRSSQLSCLGSGIPSLVGAFDSTKYGAGSSLSLSTSSGEREDVIQLERSERAEKEARPTGWLVTFTPCGSLPTFCIFPMRPYSFPGFLRLHAPQNQIGFFLGEDPSAFVFE
ncbi:hypothetical protein HAX54_032423 [Datura stramonium]|uniref:Uncharacterized protein n=1 Tax=Datura stramonium TaxID=4076 RepID=A0ABS8VAK5_DATST|nr:hypothetical protein [Datura stramonium]